MKKSIFLVFIVVLFSSCTQKKVKISDPQAYNDSIVFVLQSVQNPFDTLLYSLYSINIDLNKAGEMSIDSVNIDFDIIDKRYKNTNNSIDKALKRIQKYQFTEDDKGFKESIIRSIDSIDLILENEINTIITVLKKPKSQYAYEVSSEILPIGKEIFRKYNSLFVNLMKVQMTYNAYYKYVLSDNYILYRF